MPELCLDSTMNDKTTFNTMIRMIGTWNAFGHAYLRVFQFYNWKRVPYAQTHINTHKHTNTHKHFFFIYYLINGRIFYINGSFDILIFFKVIYSLLFSYRLFCAKKITSIIYIYI